MQIPEQLETPAVVPAAFSVVTDGYATSEVDAYSLAMQRRVAELEDQARRIDPELVAKDVFLRSVTNAMGSAYDVIADAGREAGRIRTEAAAAAEEARQEVEAHRDQLEGLDAAWEQIEVARSELRTATKELETAQNEELEQLRATLAEKEQFVADLEVAHAQALVDTHQAAVDELADERGAFEAEREQIRSDAADESERMRTEAAAESEALRSAAQAAAEEVLGSNRSEVDHELTEAREQLASARQRADEERRIYLELRQRLTQKWEELHTSQLPAPPSAGAPAVPPVPEATDEAFGAFFSEDVEDEPSRQWMFTSE